MKTHERIHFRLFSMPCCGHLICWVNPRLPNYCPECGKRILMDLRFEGSHTRISDKDAVLTMKYIPSVFEDA